MLLGLLLFCLAAPLVWRHDRASSDLPDVIAPDGLTAKVRTPKAVAVAWPLSHGVENLKFGVGGLFDTHKDSPHRGVSDAGLLALWPQPTIEELIAARAGMPPSIDGWMNWHGVAPSTTRHNVQSPQPEANVIVAAPGPLLTAVLERIGQATAIYRPELLKPLAGKVASICGGWLSERLAAIDWERASAPSAEVVLPPASTLRLMEPDDRLPPAPREAELEIVEPAPIIAPEPSVLDIDVASDPWCVPHTLIEQLQRLAHQAESGRWAQQTIDRLEELAARDRFEGDDVQSILADLSAAARQAMGMAEQTHQDRLRVELLRAHWGLARRIDRWAVVHEIHVAAHGRERVASRGSLGAVFQDIPGRTTEPTDTLTLDLEQYEQSRDPQIARQIVLQQRGWSSTIAMPTFAWRSRRPC
jgi:hypothetical protein